jgi:NADH-quinone oxidoreductase subunit C
MSDPMNDHLSSAVSVLSERFGAEAMEFRGQVSLMIAAEHIVTACQALRDEYHFDMLSAQTAVDYWPQQEPRFHVIYQLYSIDHNLRLGLRVPLDSNAPSLPTISGVYPAAIWHEREIWDMFGIRFAGHPDLRRILMPYDWEGHPLRKDYPLGYEEVQFSFNYDEIDQRKPYAKE